MNTHDAALNENLPKFIEIIYKNIKYFVSETSSSDLEDGNYYDYKVIDIEGERVIIRELFLLDSQVHKSLDFFYPLYNSKHAINQNLLSKVEHLFQSYHPDLEKKILYLSILNNDGTVIHIHMNKL